MILLKSRLKRESIILSEMIRLFCKRNHTNHNTLCDECLELANYAEKRLTSCMYGDTKPVCKLCPVHCYSPGRRNQIRKVMQFSGPRMLIHRPLYAFIHFVDNLTAKDSKPIRKS